MPVNEDKMVNHPSHYQSKSGLEVIDVIAAFTEDLTGMEAFDTANIIKYICRWKKKGGVQDLKKVIWYANDLVKRIEGDDTEMEESGDISGFIEYGNYDTEHDAWNDLMKITKRVTVGENFTVLSKDGKRFYSLSNHDLNKSYVALTNDGDGTYTIMLHLPEEDQ